MMGGYISYDDYAANVRLNGGVPDPDPRAGNNNNNNGSSGGSGNSSNGSRGGSSGSGNSGGSSGGSSGGNTVSALVPPLDTVNFQRYDESTGYIYKTKILSDANGNYFARINTVEELFGISLNITRKPTDVIDSEGYYHTELWAIIDDRDVLLGYENLLYLNYGYINLTAILNAFGTILDVPIIKQGVRMASGEDTNCGPTSGAMVEAFYNPNTEFDAAAISNAVTRARQDWLEDKINRGYDYSGWRKENVEREVGGESGAHPIEFNAIAGLSYGLTLIENQLSFNALKNELENDHPLMTYIKYDEKNFHMLVIRGYVTINGIDYIAYNDPWGVFLIQSFDTFKTQSGAKGGGVWEHTYRTKPR
jgi:hypothetical protein